MFHPPAWWDRGGSPAGSFFLLQTLILCLVTTSIWESFRVVFSDNGWRCSWLVKNASSSRAQWTLCSGKVKSQGIEKLQVVVVEFWTLEPTMSSAIITMGRSPTACPFGKPSLSNKISSWIFFHDFHCRYSNNVYIPGHHTLPDDMEQSWVTCHHQVLSGLFQSMPRQIVKAIEKIDSCTVRNAWKYKTNKNTNTIQILTQSGTHGKTTPWFAPGTAPVYGACGTLGGWEHERQRNVLKYFSAWNISRWPDGCKHDGKGHFGDCCSGNCDGFALGNNEEYEDMCLWYDYY